MVKTHQLKIHPQFFKDVALNLKKFEIRFNDRNYKEGDILILKEWNPETEKYTGNTCVRKINYILADVAGLQEGYVILQVAKLL